MKSSFSQESSTSAGVSLFEKCLWYSVLKPWNLSFFQNLFCFTKLKVLDILLLFEILLRKSVAADLELCFLLLGDFHRFFTDLRMSLELLQYFDLLSSVSNSNIVWFRIFSLSSFGAFFHLHPLSNISTKSSTIFICFLIDKVHVASFQPLV